MLTKFHLQNGDGSLTEKENSKRYYFFSFVITWKKKNREDHKFELVLKIRNVIITEW